MFVFWFARLCFILGCIWVARGSMVLATVDDCFDTCPAHGCNQNPYPNLGTRAQYECNNRTYGACSSSTTFAYLDTCATTCLFCQSGYGTPSGQGCIDNVVFRQSQNKYSYMSGPVSYHYASFAFPDSKYVNCRMPKCGTPSEPGYVYQACTPTVLSPSSAYVLEYFSRGTTCDSSFGDSGPDWYCTVQSTPPGSTIDQAIDTGSDVDVICLSNWISNGVRDSSYPYICLQTSTNLILTQGAWPPGIYQVIPNSPDTNTISNTEGADDFAPTTNPRPDWGCSSSTADCSVYEPALFYFTSCTASTSFTATPINTPPTFNLNDFITEICDWSPLQYQVGVTIPALGQDVNRASPVSGGFNTFATAPDTTTGPSGTVYTFNGAVTDCRRVSYANGFASPAMSGTTESVCLLDPRMQTVAVRPGFTKDQFFNYYTANQNSFGTMPNTFQQQPIFASLVASGGDQDNLLTGGFSGTPIFDSFLNTPLQCPTADNQQQLFRLRAYAFLSDTKIIPSASPTPQSAYRNNPGILNDWAQRSGMNNFFLRRTQNRRGDTLATPWQSAGMFWSHYDQTNCSCDERGTAGGFYFATLANGLTGCFDVSTFCVPGHCQCSTQAYTTSAVPYLGQVGFNGGFANNGPTQTSFTYKTNIKCTQTPRPSDWTPWVSTCSATKTYTSVLTKNYNTTCMCLNGWIGQRCDTCDQVTVPWFNPQTCSVTCRSPNGTTLGHAACLNGGQCAYNSFLDQAYCQCPANFTGPYCQFPILLPLQCSQGLLPIQCQIAPINGQTLLAVYTCSLNYQRMPLPDGMEIYATIQPFGVNLSPPSAVTVEDLWLTPILPYNSICPALYQTLIGSSPSSPTFQCPLPYNTITQFYNPTVDQWCLLNAFSLSTFTYMYRSINCYSMSTPIGVPIQTNTSYAWCHSNVASIDQKLFCLFSYSLSQFPTLNQIPVSSMIGLLNQQCQIGSANSQVYFETFDNCKENLCQNGASCINGLGVSTNNYTCSCLCLNVNNTCQSLYFGQYCQTPIDNCPSQNPCQNNGSCQSILGIGTYQCNCLAAWTGPNCTTPVPCVPNPCQNGGQCTNINSFTNYTCTCPTFYSGRNCENHDVCGASNPCPIGTQCNNVFPNGHFCDYCATNPCLHGGVCANAGGSYTCTCSLQFSGTNCQTTLTSVAYSTSLSCSQQAQTYSYSTASGSPSGVCDVTVPSSSTFTPCSPGVSASAISSSSYGPSICYVENDFFFQYSTSGTKPTTGNIVENVAFSLSVQFSRGDHVFQNGHSGIPPVDFNTQPQVFFSATDGGNGVCAHTVSGFTLAYVMQSPTGSDPFATYTQSITGTNSHIFTFQCTGLSHTIQFDASQFVVTATIQGPDNTGVSFSDTGNTVVYYH